MAFIGEKTACNLRMELFEKLDVLDSDFIQENSKGHVLSRLNNDLMNVREFVTVHVSEIFAQVLSILFVIMLVLTTDWRLAMIYLITLPIYIICFYLADVKSKDQYENHQRQLGRMMSYFERSLTDRSRFHERGFVKINRMGSDSFVKSINVSNVLLPLATFLTNLCKITVYIVGLYFLMSHEIQLGTLLAVIIYGQLLTKPLKKVSTSMVFLETSFSSIKRIFAIIDS
jgi:subfamily B ATP-binding cassette protein MsbA